MKIREDFKVKKKLKQTYFPSKRGNREMFTFFHWEKKLFILWSLFLKKKTLEPLKIENKYCSIEGIQISCNKQS